MSYIDNPRVLLVLYASALLDVAEICTWPQPLVWLLNWQIVVLVFFFHSFFLKLRLFSSYLTRALFTVKFI